MATTKVIFRKFKSGIAKGEIIALFPYDLWNERECASYMHVGQHSGADYNAMMMSTKPAKPEEYQELYNELIKIGYPELQVVQKRTAKGIKEERERYAKLLETLERAGV